MAEPQKKEAVPQAQKYRALKVTISGDYYNSKKEKVDFDKVVGVIPWCDEDKGLASMHVRGRYAIMWIKAAKNDDGTPKYPERIDRIHQCFIDDVVETKASFSFVGKDIKELTQEELQDLATAKNITKVPLPNSGHSKRSMLELTYAAYCQFVLNKKLKPEPHEAGFNFSKLPSLFLDASGRVDNTRKLSNDEVIEAEMRGKKVNLGESKASSENAFSLEELKQLAEETGVAYDDGITHADLYKALFSAK
jgi:hypothetical protein